MEGLLKITLFYAVLALPVSSVKPSPGRVICIEDKSSKNTFIYKLTNFLQEPMFYVTAELVLDGDSPFIHYMEKAIDICEGFTGMETKYYADIGWFIQSLNGVQEAYSTNGTFWSVLNKYGGFSSLGVSNFKPNHNDVITLNFTNIYPH